MSKPTAWLIQTADPGDDGCAEARLVYYEPPPAGLIADCRMRGSKQEPVPKPDLDPDDFLPGIVSLFP